MPSTHRKKINEKIMFIEGLRGLAMTVVVLNHFTAAFYPAIIFGTKAIPHNYFELFIYKTPFNIFFSGIFALCVFFLLSGYLLSYKFFRFYQEEPLISSIVKRYLRLMIPTLISMLIAYTILKYGLFFNRSISPITGSTMWFANFWNFEANFFNAISEGLFFTSIFIGNATYNPVMWMMGYELAGSFLVYITLKLFKISNNKILVYILLFLITWKTYLMGFVLGMLVCDLEYRSSLYISKYRKNIIGTILLIVAIYFGSFPIAQTKGTIYDLAKLPILNDSQNVIFFHTIAACFMFLAIKCFDRLEKLLEISMLRFLGKISFSVYFLHLLIIGSFSSYLFKILIGHLNYNKSVVITFLITFPIILTISFYFNKYITLNSVKIANSAKNFINTRYHI